MLVFAERRKPVYPEKNLSEQRRKPTTNSTHIWRQVRESNPGHIGGRRVLSPLRHPCSPALSLALCLHGSLRRFTVPWRPRGPFLESPVNFTGPKSNIQIEIKRIRALVLASKLLHFVSLTDSFIMLDAKLLKPRSLRETETAYRAR